MERMNNQQKSQSGNRLVGWLVSYALDSKGRAYEIRSGRSFITANELPGQRGVTLADGTIECAHLALSASQRHKVMIQDIFSDSGTFVTKAGSPKETRVAGPMELEHGDWVRIGEKTRFQVCLIDGSAR